MASKRKAIPLAISILAVGVMASEGKPQQTPEATKATLLLGLSDVKSNTSGSVAVDNGKFRFTHSGVSSELATASMQGVETGNDSQRMIRGTVGTLSQFGPYGSGRVLSLFRSKIDTLTIQYRDENGGLHGAIFTLPVGSADTIKKELVAQGAPAGTPVDTKTAATEPVDAAANTKGAEGQDKPPVKINASAIEIMMIQSDEIHLPAEFQISLYENLIQREEKTSGLRHVYRDGDRGAGDARDLVVLRSTVRGFKQGSEEARQVTTVAGATSIDVHCEFADGTGNVLLTRDIKGKVLFFGGNLRATYDFAKKAAVVTRENFRETPQ